MRLFRIVKLRLFIAVVFYIALSALGAIPSVNAKSIASLISSNTIGLGFITNNVNSWLGNGDVVNPCSGAYSWGRGFGYGYNAAAIGESAFSLYKSWPAIREALQNAPKLAETMCFTEGTPVQMANGSVKPVEEVKEGDLVQAKDPQTGEMSAGKVTQTLKRQAPSTVTLTFSTGEVVECTPEHPFYVEGVGFTPAGQLGIGTSIVTRAGPAVQVTKVEQHDAPATVYNLTVEDAHTYFVGQTGLWVHNDCGPSLTEAKNLMRRWAPDPETGRIADSIRYHFGKHGADVGADNVWQYLRKADNFGAMKGRGIPIDGRIEGVLRYFKNGRYIDIGPDGRIISFGGK